MATPKRWRVVSNEELTNLYCKEGLSQREVAERLGVHRVTVIRGMKKFGIPVRTREWSHEENEFLIKNYAVLTQKEIGKKLGRTRKAVSTHAYNMLGLDKIKIRLEYETKRLKKLIGKLTPEEIGYFAGLIDGEGSICVTVQSKKDGLMSTPKISVANTNPLINEWVSNTKIFQVHSHVDARFPNSKEIHAYSTTGFKTLPLLELLIPHLKGKKENAILLASFIRQRNSHEKTKHFTKKELDLLRKIILLNKALPATLERLDYYERRWCSVEK